ncbi:MAG TPA: RNA-binding protein, partial [Blastocatellia bacterium]|nr:RNA-binding protein [Blastocatellia bacterium]
MANKTLFRSFIGKLIPPTDAVNDERSGAYAFKPKHALAQYAATGCLNSTFYADAKEHLDNVLELCRDVEPEFIARTALYARERGLMKDMPAMLCAVLSLKDRALLARVFPRVIDNGKMLRSFVQIVRSGVVGRKSLGSAPKRLVREWFESRTDEQVFTASVGQSPSLADVIRMVHPKPASPERSALYAYLTGRNHEASALPEAVRKFEAFKAGDRDTVPNVPFQMLTALNPGKAEWLAIARHASWQTTRMNLNTFLRHGIFEDAETAALVASRLSNAEAIRKARVFPYQLMAAFSMADEKMPRAIRDALQDAMEIAISNVPKIAGEI